MYGLYIINKAGGLIFDYDFNLHTIELEKTFSYPLQMSFKIFDERVVVDFGQQDGIKVGHVILGINGVPIYGCGGAGGETLNKDEVMALLEDESQYPLSIKFGRPRITSNEKLMLASMFHSLFAIVAQLSPVPKSSGIKSLETSSFKIFCKQTITGIKFMLITDLICNNQDALLAKIYELYADYALKDPHYTMEMPIRSEKFNLHIKEQVEYFEKIHKTYNP